MSGTTAKHSQRYRWQLLAGEILKCWRCGIEARATDMRHGVLGKCHPPPPICPPHHWILDMAPVNGKFHARCKNYLMETDFLVMAEPKDIVINGKTIPQEREVEDAI